MSSDIEKARASNKQLRLFPSTPRDICQRIGLNWMTAVSLHQRGILSFAPATVESLSDGQEAELTFLGSLVASGCDEGMLEHMLRGLQRPYQYLPDRVYYHWPSQEWRLMPQDEDVDMEQVFQDWIHELVEAGDNEQLSEIETTVREAIERVKMDEKKS